MLPELMVPELMVLASGGSRQRMLSWAALVAQGIEHRPPEPGAQVRILPGAPGTNQGVSGPDVADMHGFPGSKDLSPAAATSTFLPPAGSRCAPRSELRGILSRLAPLGRDPKFSLLLLARSISCHLPAGLERWKSPRQIRAEPQVQR